MSPLDLAVLVFFALIAVKAVTDSLKFWKDQDELAFIETEIRRLEARPAVDVHNKNTVRVTRTQYRVYRRVDVNRSACSPAPLHKDLHLRRGAGRQMKTAA